MPIRSALARRPAFAANRRRGLFLKNNERIDFAELERRVTLEIGRLARSADASPARAPLWKTDPSRDTGLVTAAMTGENQMQSEPAPRRTIWRSLANLMWGVLHLPTVLRRGIAGVYAAEYARSGVEELRQVIDTLQMRVASAEATISSVVENPDPRDLSGEIDRLRRAFSTRFDDLDRMRQDFRTADATLLARIEELATQLSRMTGRMSGMTDQVSRLADQAAVLKREVVFQQRQ